MAMVHHAIEWNVSTDHFVKNFTHSIDLFWSVLEWLKLKDGIILII